MICFSRSGNVHITHNCHAGNKLFMFCFAFFSDVCHVSFMCEQKQKMMVDKSKPSSYDGGSSKYKTECYAFLVLLSISMYKKSKAHYVEEGGGRSSSSGGGGVPAAGGTIFSSLSELTSRSCASARSSLRLPLRCDAADAASSCVSELTAVFNGRGLGGVRGGVTLRVLTLDCELTGDTSVLPCVHMCVRKRVHAFKSQVPRV